MITVHISNLLLVSEAQIQQ